MKKIITLIMFIFSYLITIGQIATIEDKDGYTNVRKAPNSNALVIYKTKTGELFWYAPDDYSNKTTEWVKVYIPKNKFSIECGALDELQGYVHKSRIIPLNKLKKYSGNDLIFKYTLVPFNKEDKIIGYSNDKYIVHINGLHPWGTDGDLPTTEIKAIKVSIESKEIFIPKILFMDIYECGNEFDFYKIENKYIVFQFNSDGAGGYDLAWVITKEGIKQRLVGTLY